MLFSSDQIIDFDIYGPFR